MHCPTSASTRGGGTCIPTTSHPSHLACSQTSRNWNTWNSINVRRVRHAIVHNTRTISLYIPTISQPSKPAYSPASRTWRPCRPAAHPPAHGNTQSSLLQRHLNYRTHDIRWPHKAGVSAIPVARYPASACTEISLHYNAIKSISSEAFSNLTLLEYLDGISLCCKSHFSSIRTP